MNQRRCLNPRVVLWPWPGHFIWTGSLSSYCKERLSALPHVWVMSKASTEISQEGTYEFQGLFTLPRGTFLPQCHCPTGYKFLPCGAHKHHMGIHVHLWIYLTKDFCKPQDQQITMQSEQLSKANISSVAASSREAQHLCTEFWPCPSSFAWAVSVSLFSPHTLFWRTCYPISHCDSPTLQINVISLLTSEYQIPPRRATDPQHAWKTCKYRRALTALDSCHTKYLPPCTAPSRPFYPYTGWISTEK